MKQKVLIVDDEVSILQSLSGILEDEGYGVTLAVSGEEAFEKVEERYARSYPARYLDARGRWPGRFWTKLRSSIRWFR